MAGPPHSVPSDLLVAENDAVIYGADRCEVITPKALLAAQFVERLRAPSVVVVVGSVVVARHTPAWLLKLEMF